MRYPDPLDWLVLGNSVGRWLAALAVLAGFVTALYVVRRIIVRRLDRIAARTATGIDDLVVQLARRTKFFAILAVAIAGAAYVVFIGDRAHGVVNRAAVVALAFQAALWGSEIVNFALARYAQRQDGTANGATATTLTALGYMARGLLWVVILLVALATVGINVTALVTGLGVGGVAIALAVQNILGDLFGALSIVLDKPFVVGDSIAVDQFVGTVEHIGLKTTRLRAVGGEQLIFANADLLKSRIRNFKRQTERRVVFNFTVASETSTEAAAGIPSLVRAAVEGIPGSPVRFERAHLVRPADGGFEYETVYHVPTADYTQYLDAQQAIVLALLEQFRGMGVDFSTGGRSVVVLGGGDTESAGPGGGPADGPLEPTLGGQTRGRADGSPRPAGDARPAGTAAS